MRRRDDAPSPADRAVLAARAVERLAGWTCRPRCDVVPPSLPCLGLESRIDALIIPATVVPVQTINRTLQEARCDAVVVVAADDPCSPITGQLAIRRAGAVDWHGPCRFWSSPLGELWLVGAADLGSAGIAVLLGSNRLALGSEPWKMTGEATGGLELAAKLLAGHMEVLR